MCFADDAIQDDRRVQEPSGDFVFLQVAAQPERSVVRIHRNEKTQYPKASEYATAE